MGCANSKTSGATGALEAPEGGDGAPPKVMVDGEGQDGVAVNGNAVACANGAEETTGEEKAEACNGDLNNKSEENENAPSGEEKSEQNGGCENEGGQSIQDGGDEAEKESKPEEATESKEEETAEATDSENVESRENNEEEKAE